MITKLREVGLEKGDTVMVHTSLKRMGYVCGGAQTVIEALMDVVGEAGTIMMPPSHGRIWIRKQVFTGKPMKRTGSSSAIIGQLMIKN